jgi:hypothetical protein
MAVAFEVLPLRRCVLDSPNQADIPRAGRVTRSRNMLPRDGGLGAVAPWGDQGRAKRSRREPRSTESGFHRCPIRFASIKANI